MLFIFWLGNRHIKSCCKSFGEFARLCERSWLLYLIPTRHKLTNHASGATRHASCTTRQCVTHHVHAWWATWTFRPIPQDLILISSVLTTLKINWTNRSEEQLKFPSEEHGSTSNQPTFKKQRYKTQNMLQGMCVGWLRTDVRLSSHSNLMAVRELSINWSNQFYITTDTTIQAAANHYWSAVPTSTALDDNCEPPVFETKNEH